MKRFGIVLVTAFFVLTAPSSAAGPTFEIAWHTIDGGGGTSSGAAFEVSGTIAQPDAGDMAGAAWDLLAGYWTASAAGPPPCPADLDGSGSVDFGDLLTVLASWGPCAGCPADLDGSGDVGFSDLLMVLSAWGVCP